MGLKKGSSQFHIWIDLHTNITNMETIEWQKPICFSDIFYGKIDQWQIGWCQYHPLQLPEGWIIGLIAILLDNIIHAHSEWSTRIVNMTIVLFHNVLYVYWFKNQTGTVDMPHYGDGMMVMARQVTIGLMIKKLVNHWSDSSSRYVQMVLLWYQTLMWSVALCPWWWMILQRFVVFIWVRFWVAGLPWDFVTESHAVLGAAAVAIAGTFISAQMLGSKRKLYGSWLCWVNRKFGCGKNTYVEICIC